MKNFLRKKLNLRIISIFLILMISKNLEANSKDPYPASMTKTWAEKNIDFYYNPINHPAWAKDEEVIEFIKNNAKKWQKCGINLNFAGITSENDKKPNAILIGWIDSGKNKHGITKRRYNKTRITSARILLSTTVLGKSPNEIPQNEEETKKLWSRIARTATHEIGHAIGFTHSSNCDNVMSRGCGKIDRERKYMPDSPSLEEISLCEKRYLNEL